MENENITNDYMEFEEVEAYSKPESNDSGKGLGVLAGVGIGAIVSIAAYKGSKWIKAKIKSRKKSKEADAEFECNYCDHDDVMDDNIVQMDKENN